MSIAAQDGALSPVLSVRGLAKHFGGVQAVRDVHLDLLSGEIHGLVGANGAGKSTFIRMLAGIETPDAGEIKIDGRALEIRDAQHAAQLGLSFIHQELNLVPKFTGRQNMLLGLRTPTRFGVIDWGGVRSQTDAVAQRLGIPFSLDVPVEKLSVADRWLVSIARALVERARLVAMDEPTASLSSDEATRLFRIVRELADQGVSILYVSHRLDEVRELCDRVTVFKDGRQVVTLSREEATRPALMRAIVGTDLAAITVPPVEASSDASPVLQVQGVSRPPAVRDVSFQLGKGEVLGIAGLVGAGRTELARLIFGADKLTAGEMRLDGKPFRPTSTYAAVRRGVALVPEERRSQGLILRKSVAFNVNLAIASRFRVAHWLPLVVQQRANVRARQVAESLGIQPRRTDVIVNRLSGGNQQKVVMGKWLDRSARVLILDEPTRGVDVGARVELHRIIRELAAGGLGVIMISSDFEELLGCDRVLVMAEGQIRRELSGPEISEQAILEACYSHEVVSRN